MKVPYILIRPGQICSCNQHYLIKQDIASSFIGLSKGKGKANVVDALDEILQEELEKDYMLEDVDIAALIKSLKPFLPILLKLFVENEKELVEGLECLKPIFGKLIKEFLLKGSVK